MRRIPVVLATNVRRWLAGLCFAAFGFLAASLFFLHRPIAAGILILYVVLPCLCAGAAGFAWGGPILERETGWGASILRSVGITAGAYVLFAPLYAVGLTLVERGWSLRQTPALTFMALTLGLLMVGRIIFLAGILAGALLHGLARSALLQFADPVSKPPETRN